jgi:hypothetical protein
VQQKQRSAGFGISVIRKTEANVHVLYKDEHSSVQAAKIEGICMVTENLDALRTSVLQRLAEKGIKHRVREDW